MHYLQTNVCGLRRELKFENHLSSMPVTVVNCHVEVSWSSSQTKTVIHKETGLRMKSGCRAE
eukprot:6812301-Pyramimonas_sp.AAC.1